MSPRLRQLTAPATVFAQHGLAQQQMVLLLCCVMHAIHDGYTSAMYLLLPLIATDLQLSYAQRVSRKFVCADRDRLSWGA
jgi:hypothetical protein